MHVIEYVHNGQKLRDESIDSIDEIRRRFAREGKIILSVKKKFYVQSVPKSEVVAFLTAMGDLADSGVHMTKALDSVIASFSEKSSFPAMLRKIREAVANGMPMGSAMAAYQHIFGRTVVAMVQAGEHTGRLSETFIAGAEFITSQDEIKKELWKKLTYPAITLTMGIASLVVNSTIVIPKLMKSDLFKMANKNSSQNDLASYCIKALNWMSVVVPSFLLFLFVLAGLSYAFYKHNQEDAEKRIISLPGIREFIFYRAYYVAFSSLSKLVAVGVKLDEALEIVERSTPFITLRHQFSASREAIRQGQAFTKGLKALSPVEKTMLDTAQDITRIHKNFGLIAQRYHRLYLEKIRAVSPKVQTFVVLLVVAIFFLEFLGIMLPYSKIMSSVK